ncbi:putative oxidoreductase-like protein [Lupinus albus]|uniref:Putative oxidoreductase-like protein n=1 Tax=Lupinus albus TaxID=3870 RepID=A0A6A4QMV1_LUPAL|nr:putative oxidoreductase-like protein [Lupinus albus]
MALVFVFVGSKEERENEVIMVMRVGVTQKLFHLNLITNPNPIPIPIPIPIQRTSLFFHQPFPMADSTPSNVTPAPHPIQPDNNEKPFTNPPKEIPPPPEKPDPGDCCGSGCVRCVWDIYYDELEEYDKLYKHDNNNIKS